MSARGSLALADGTTWCIEARDAPAEEIVSGMMEVMRMHHAKGGAVASSGDPLRRLFVSVDGHGATSAASNLIEQDAAAAAQDDSCTGDRRNPWPEWASIHEEGENEIHCILRPLEGECLRVVRIMRLTTLIAMRAHWGGGLLVHGALAEREGQGVILAGPGGVGKTTASQRLTPPWRSLSDDKTLVMHDAQGEFRAHPWPTWSNLLNGDSRGEWDVQHSVPLRGIFLLSQGKTDQVRFIGKGEALCLLLDSADQTLNLVSRDLQPEERRALYLRQFSNARELVKAVPSHRLILSPKGDFWLEIEAALQRDSK